MSITTQWLDQQHTTIYQLFDHSWTPEEFDAQYHQIEEWVGSVDHDVSLVVELSHVEPPPVSDLEQHSEKFPRKLHALVVVNDDDMVMRLLLSLINRITPPTRKSPIVIVSDLHQAYEVLELPEQSLA